LEDGTLRHFNNVPDSAKVNVNGQQLGVRDLKPGMKLERTTITTSTPRTVTTTKSVTGTVWHVTPPTSVILTMENGKNQQFTIPDGQKFNVDGQMLDAFGLKKGMKISATKVVEVPETVVSHERNVSGTMAPAPPPADQPVLLVVVRETPAPAPAAAPAAEPAPKALPKTATSTPLLAFVGLCFIAMAFGIKILRRSQA
jgi:LPXTG-motif cell wall-anchored protein